MSEWFLARWADLRDLPAIAVFLFGLGSVLMFVGSIVFTAWILVTLPPTYFLDRRPPAFAERHPAIRWMGLIGKNLMGGLMVLVGLVLALPGVPGQGVLTILIGVMLLDFPGKRRLELKLVSYPPVTRAIDRVRRRFQRAPLVLQQPPLEVAESTASPQGTPPAAEL
jgi:hypothetical protein